MHLTALSIGSLHVVAPRPVVPGTAVLTTDADLGVTGVWDRVQLPHDRVALCTPYATFLSCQVAADGALRITLTDDLGPCEAFEEVLWPDGAVSLRTCERTFLAAVPGAPVSADGEQGDQATRFRYDAVPASLATRVTELRAGAPRVADMPRQFARPTVETRE